MLLAAWTKLPRPLREFENVTARYRVDIWFATCADCVENMDWANATVVEGNDLVFLLCHNGVPVP